MKDIDTIKAELNRVTKTPSLTEYGEGYRDALEFVLRPKLDINVGDLFITDKEEIVICVAHKPYAWWYFIKLGDTGIYSVRSEHDIEKAFGHMSLLSSSCDLPISGLPAFLENRIKG